MEERTIIRQFQSKKPTLRKTEKFVSGEKTSPQNLEKKSRSDIDCQTVPLSIIEVPTLTHDKIGMSLVEHLSMYK